MLDTNLTIIVLISERYEEKPVVTLVTGDVLALALYNKCIIL